MMLSSSSAESVHTRSTDILPQSILGLAIDHHPLASRGQDHISYVTGEYWAQVTAQGETTRHVTTALAIDPGNSNCKTVAIHAQQRTFAVVETPTQYEEYPNLIYATGQDEIWQVRYYDEEQLRRYQQQYAHDPSQIPPQYSEAFSIGANAIKGTSLPIGTTNERLHDLAYQRFLQACIVRTLIEAGYGPGQHYIGYAFGVRDEEVSAKAGVNPDTKIAVNEVLKNPFVLVRNTTECWHILPVDEDPLLVPQSFGMYYAWDSDLYGNILHTAPSYTVFDLGYHDGHIIEVRRGKNGALRVSGHKVTQGVSEIARGLAVYMRQPGNFPQLPHLNDAEAQEMMRLEEVKLGGIPLQNSAEAVRAQKLIRGYKHRQGGVFISTLVSQHPAMDSIFLFGGGGVFEFGKEIEHKMMTTQRDRSLYTILPQQVAVIGNALGLYWIKNIACRPLAAKR